MHDPRRGLMALADQSVHGYPEVYRLFAYRLPTDGTPAAHRAILASMAEGGDPLVACVR